MRSEHASSGLGSNGSSSGPSSSDSSSSSSSNSSSGVAAVVVLQPAPATSQFVVCKISKYREQAGGAMDSYKYAAATNEWQTFQKHAAQLQHRNLVQLLGYAKTSTTISIVSEFCAGGDLQMVLDSSCPATPGTQAQPKRTVHVTGTRDAVELQQQQSSNSNGSGGTRRSSSSSCSSRSVALNSNILAMKTSTLGSSSSGGSEACDGNVRVVPSNNLTALPEGCSQSTRGDPSSSVASVTSTGLPGPRCGAMIESQVWCVAQDVLSGLAAMHHVGLTHGDVKPANIFLTLQPGGTPGLMGTLADDDGAAVVPLLYKLGDCAWFDSPSRDKAWASTAVADAAHVLLLYLGSQALEATYSATPCCTTLCNEGTDAIPVFIDALCWQGCPHVLAAPSSAVCLPSALQAEMGPAVRAVARGTPSAPASSLLCGLPACRVPDLNLLSSCVTCPVLRRPSDGTMRESGRKHLHYFVSGFGFTPSYACPEALRRGTGATDIRSDLWSVGVVIVQLLLGYLPHIADAMDRMQAAEHHGAREAWLAANPPAASSLAQLKSAGVQVSPSLRVVLEAVLQVSPGRRPASAAELLAFPWFNKAPR
ncbi:hypothetical protein QJQ45_013985 [Haematococcus lacustris]|nr:hypothetical protein QJQ45_013985 [Haematococcus lacustris]